MRAELPTGLLWRVGGIARGCGLPLGKVLEMAGAGALGGGPLFPGGRRYFLRTVVRSVLMAESFVSLFGAVPAAPLCRFVDLQSWLGLTRDQLLQVVRRLPAECVFRKDMNAAAYYRPQEICVRVLRGLAPAGMMERSAA